NEYSFPFEPRHGFYSLWFSIDHNPRRPPAPLAPKLRRRPHPRGHAVGSGGIPILSPAIGERMGSRKSFLRRPRYSLGSVAKVLHDMKCQEIGVVGRVGPP